MGEVDADKKRLELILSSISDVFVSLDYNLRYTYINDRAIAISKMQREELIGKSLWESFPDLLGTVFETELHRAVAEQRSVQFEFFYARWNSWFEHCIQPSEHEIFIFSTDITDRKLADQALRDSQRLVQQIAEMSPAMLYLFDVVEQRNVYVNTQSLKSLGYSQTTIVQMGGEFIAQCMHPDDRAQLPAHIEQLSTHPVGDFLEFEYRMQHANGEWRWFCSRDTVFSQTPDGRLWQILGLAYDITDRKQVEATLRQSELSFRTLADTMPQLFWTTQPDGYHDYFNQRWYKYTGMTLEQTQGWGWSHLLHPDDRQRCFDVWHESLHTGKNYHIEYRFQRVDGQYRWFLGQAFPLRDAQGEITRWFGSCTDIHDQRCALEERDRALEQERVAREQAESANRIKDEFLAVLSHELRSPLNPILGWTKLLQTRRFDQQSTKRALETIERNARQQTQLIDDLLDISRVLSGKLSLNQAPIDLVATIEAALETVCLAAEAKSIHIYTQLAPIVGNVLGDGGRLQQVIWNLLSNAVKFTPANGHITVRLVRVGSEAQIQVQDTGKGIAADFLPFVFESFRQEDSKTTRQFGGLGLGLAIVRHLTELHGGTVRAESLGEDQGSTFTIALPLIEEANELTAHAAKPTVSMPRLPLVGLRLLVVDDEADMRDLISTILQQTGAIVTVVTSATEALAVFDQVQPDVLVSDIGMPLVDGYELMRQLRDRLAQQNRSIPAIALTAYATEHDQQNALAAGFQHHLSKPIDPDVLINIIAALSNNPI